MSSNTRKRAQPLRPGSQARRRKESDVRDSNFFSPGSVSSHCWQDLLFNFSQCSFPGKAGASQAKSFLDGRAAVHLISKEAHRWEEQFHLGAAPEANDAVNLKPEATPNVAHLGGRTPGAARPTIRC